MSQLSPESIAFEATASLAHLANQDSVLWQMVDTLGLAVNEPSKGTLTYWGVEINGTASMVLQELPGLYREIGRITTTISDGWTRRFVREGMADAIEKLHEQPYASLLYALGKLATPFAENMGASYDTVMMYALSGAQYHNNRPAVHEDGSYMTARCARDIGGATINWSGAIIDDHYQLEAPQCCVEERTANIVKFLTPEEK